MDVSIGIVAFALRAAALPAITDTSGQVVLIRIIGLFLLALGLGMLAMGATQFRLGAASEQWPTTPGRITASTVSQQNRGKLGTVYMPTITYSYTVDGTRLTSKRWAYGRNAYAFKEDAQAIASCYPVGADTTVHYAPGRPQRAALEPGVHDVFWPTTSVGAGVVTSLAGVLFLFDPPGFGGGGSSGYHSPFDLVALVVVIVAAIGGTIWTARRKGYYNPWAPTIGTGAALLVALVFIDLGRSAPVTVWTVIFEGIVLMAFVGLMYAISRFGVRKTPTSPPTPPAQPEQAPSAHEHAHSGV